MFSRKPRFSFFFIGYQGQDAIFGAVYAHKGRTKNWNSKKGDPKHKHRSRSKKQAQYGNQFNKVMLAVLLIALSCELNDFYAVVCTKEAHQISDLSPPTQSTFGRLLGRIEEGKGEAYATKIDVRCSDRNRIIAEKHILIATGGSTTAEMAMKYSSFSYGFPERG